MQDPRQNPLFYPLALHRLPEVGAATYNSLIEHFGSAEETLKQPASQLDRLLKPVTVVAILDFQRNLLTSDIGKKVLADLQWLAGQADIGIISLQDKLYPELLRHIPKPPPLLFVRGDIHCLGLPQIAVVGSRNPSTSGIENSQRFARFLANSGFAVTSGLALGIDAAAHEGALLENGKTIAVMGTGIDLVYPSRHRLLAQQILESGGALVSEFPLGTASMAANFPQRNRIISGLSCGVLVIEAALQSGSLITAQTALQQNREVFAIPGSIHNPLVRGCHQLIRQGATLVETGKDIIEQLEGMLGFQREKLVKSRRTKIQFDTRALTDNDAQNNIDLLSPTEQQLIQVMGYDTVNIDELVERTGLAVGAIAAQLVVLEIKGLVQQFGSGYQRI